MAKDTFTRKGIYITRWSSICEWGSPYGPCNKQGKSETSLIDIIVYLIVDIKRCYTPN